MSRSITVLAACSVVCCGTASVPWGRDAGGSTGDAGGAGSAGGAAGGSTGGAGGAGTGGGGSPFGPVCAFALDCPPPSDCTYADCLIAGASPARTKTCVYFGFNENRSCALAGGGYGICLKGACTTGVPLGCLDSTPPGPVVCPACDDGDPCTVDSCVGGYCHHDPVPNAEHAACSAPDGAPGQCKAGFCCF